MARKKLDNMTAEELEGELIRQSNERDDLRTRQLEVQGHLDARRAEEKVESVVDGLSEPERQALRQAIGPEGIETEEDA
jgi:hypothetical protein